MRCCGGDDEEVDKRNIRGMGGGGGGGGGWVKRCTKGYIRSFGGWHGEKKIREKKIEGGKRIYSPEAE